MLANWGDWNRHFEAAGRLAMGARDVLAARERETMSQRKIGRACSTGVLAAALLLAGSAPAGAAGKGPASLWGWIMEEWKEWTGSVLVPSRSAGTPGSRDRIWIKAGPGIDPNGDPQPRTACQDCGDPELGTGPGEGL